MNAIRKTLLSLALLLAATLPGKGQQLRWELNFDTQFDNREYSGSRLDGSQTLFGARLTPVVGMGWEGKHSVMIGVDLQADFGQRASSQTPICSYTISSTPPDTRPTQESSPGTNCWATIRAPSSAIRPSSTTTTSKGLCSSTSDDGGGWKSPATGTA